MTEIPKKINSPTGIPFRLIKFLYHPSAVVDCGQLTDWVFVNTAAIPFAIFILAMDTINGGTFQYATRYPLNTPNSTPIRMLITRLGAIGTPYVVRQYPETREQQNITGPMEKSIPPVAITNVTPNERNPRKYT